MWSPSVRTSKRTGNRRKMCVRHDHDGVRTIKDSLSYPFDVLWNIIMGPFIISQCICSPIIAVVYIWSLFLFLAFVYVSIKTFSSIHFTIYIRPAAESNLSVSHVCWVLAHETARVYTHTRSDVCGPIIAQGEICSNDPCLFWLHSGTAQILHSD